MKIISGLFLVICMTACSHEIKNCGKNNMANADWESRLTTIDTSISIAQGDSYFIEDSDKVAGNAYKVEMVQYTVRYYSDNGYDTLFFVKASFPDACLAEDKLNNDFNYYKSAEPKYEYNNSASWGFLQGADYYSASRGRHTELLFKNIMQAFLGSVHEERSAFYRETNKVAQWK